MFNSPSDLLAGYVEISSLPMIYEEINEAINNPRKSLSDIAKIVSEDSGLSARVLRLANSAFYSFSSHVETVSRAVTVVGMQELRALAILTSVMNLFKGIPKELVNMDSFWRHSIACGLAARVIASFRHEANAEVYFTEGILHDIGRLIMFKKAPDEALKAISRSSEEKIPLHIAERDIFGFDHASVGRALLRTWRLSPRMEEVIAFHHSPKSAVRFPVETSIVHVAEVIAHVLQFGSSGEPCVPPLDSEAWARIGLPSSIFAPTLEQVERQYQEAIASLISDISFK